MARCCFYSCLSVCSRGSPCDHMTNDALYLTLQGAMVPWTLGLGPPNPDPWTSGMGTLWPHHPVASGGHHCRPVQTCSLEDPSWYWHLVAKAHMVGNRTVRILLECFLVSIEDKSISQKIRKKRTHISIHVRMENVTWMNDVTKA